MIDVRVGFAVDDLQETDIVEFLRVMDPILAAPTGASWTIDLTGCHYLGPAAAVVIASSRLVAATKSQVPIVRLPQSPPALRAFCRFAGLDSLVTSGVIGEPSDPLHPKNETSPLQQFRRTIWGGGTPIVRLIRRHLPGLGTESEGLLHTCYSEIAQNIEDHAESPIGGVICARYFANKHEIRIAVVDRGLGIAEKLRRSEGSTKISIQDDVHALQLVLQGNVTSKSRTNNMGQGISNLALIAGGNGGRLMIVSGRAWAAADERGPRFQHLVGSGFPGTLVLLSLRVAPGDIEHDSG